MAQSTLPHLGRCIRKEARILSFRGPILDKGGLYNIRVDVEGATSPITLLTSRLSFETFVSVAQEQPFAIQTASAEIPVVIKTYYDDVGNFGFEQADGSISFDMPFRLNNRLYTVTPVKLNLLILRARTLVAKPPSFNSSFRSRLTASTLAQLPST